MYAFVDTLQWPHDSNLTINVLEEVIAKLHTKSGILPEVLYMQMDNCYRKKQEQVHLGVLRLTGRIENLQKSKDALCFPHALFLSYLHMFPTYADQN